MAVKLRDMVYEAFRSTVAAAGLAARDCGNGHWQIKGGGILVNFYPWAKDGPCYYLAGTTGKRQGNVHAAILAAGKPPPVVPKEGRDPRAQGSNRKQRMWLFGKDPHCHWCKELMDFEDSTLDHVIPHSRGGLNNPNNIVLAHTRCNHDRGADMPELKNRPHPLASLPPEGLLKIFSNSLRQSLYYCDAITRLTEGCGVFMNFYEGLALDDEDSDHQELTRAYDAVKAALEHVFEEVKAAEALNGPMVRWLLAEVEKRTAGPAPAAQAVSEGAAAEGAAAEETAPGQAPSKPSPADDAHLARHREKLKGRHRELYEENENLRHLLDIYTGEGAEERIAVRLFQVAQFEEEIRQEKIENIRLRGRLSSQMVSAYLKTFARANAKDKAQASPLLHPGTAPTWDSDMPGSGNGGREQASEAQEATEREETVTQKQDDLNLPYSEAEGLLRQLEKATQRIKKRQPVREEVTAARPARGSVGSKTSFE